MQSIHCFAFVEDEPSKDVVVRLVDYRNAKKKNDIALVKGFPNVMRGSGNLRKKIDKMVSMAKGGIAVICLVDLDATECAPSLIDDWFRIGKSSSPTIPEKMLFRVAVREIESWIMADREGLSSFLGIAEQNFSQSPDELADPKQFLLNLLRKKGTKSFHRQMVPSGSAHVGPRYNELLCKFVQTVWSVERARKISPSLERTVQKLSNFD